MRTVENHSKRSVLVSRNTGEALTTVTVVTCPNYAARKKNMMRTSSKFLDFRRDYGILVTIEHTYVSQVSEDSMWEIILWN